VSSRNTFVRSLHDLGLAAWFGGSLMGAVALNGAANDITDEKDRARVAASGWARWSPVAAAAIGAHAVGGLGLLVANRRRVAAQSGVTANTAVKTVLTGAAIGATAYSARLGARVAQAGRIPADGGAIPGEQTPDDVARAQQQLRYAQWAIPALTGVLVVLGALQGEQQRPAQVAAGLAARAARTGRSRWSLRRAAAGSAGATAPSARSARSAAKAERTAAKADARSAAKAAAGAAAKAGRSAAKADRAARSAKAA